MSLVPQPRCVAVISDRMTLPAAVGISVGPIANVYTRT